MHEFSIPFHSFHLTSTTQVLGAYFPFLHHHALCLATRIYPFLVALHSIFFITISYLRSHLQPSVLSFSSYLNYRRWNTPAKQSVVNFPYKQRTKNSWETKKQPWPWDSVLPGENWETKSQHSLWDSVLPFRSTGLNGTSKTTSIYEVLVHVSILQRSPTNHPQALFLWPRT